MPPKKSRPEGKKPGTRPAGDKTFPRGRQPAKKEVIGRNGSGTESPAAVTYADLLRPLIETPAGARVRLMLQSSPLAHLDYPAELKIKNQALALFWQRHRLPGKPEPVIAAPRPRHYRTTSKRRTLLKGNTLYLLFHDRALPSRQKPFVESPLEPPEHGRIYTYLQQKISEPAFKLVAAHLNYLIIRGSYTHRAVIFNVDTMNGSLVRKLKILAGHLQKLPDGADSAFIYPDPSGSNYYLESEQPADILKFKKLYGRAGMSVTHHGCRYVFHPTSFSQVNEAMVPVMLELVKELLEPDRAATLLDLYCGYGLFSHFLAPGYKQVVGIDAEGPSIQAAIANKQSNPASRNARFLARNITERSMEDLPLADDLTAEAILLDPPRQGPRQGVISALSRRNPGKVLHIHCGIDQIPHSVRQWKQNGYRILRIVPLDMFPGSLGLEVLILYEPLVKLEH